MGPWSAGPSDMGYYVGRVARLIRNLSLKGLLALKCQTSNLASVSGMAEATAL
jgi:hypothetical protein